MTSNTSAMIGLIPEPHRHHLEGMGDSSGSVDVGFQDMFIFLIDPLGFILFSGANAPLKILEEMSE